MERKEPENNCKTKTAIKNDVEKTRPRSPSILTALDSVHRSLLIKNCEYEDEEEVKPKLPPRREKDAVYLPITWIKCNNYKRDDFIPEVGTTTSNTSSEKCTTIILNNNNNNIKTKTLPQQKQYNSNNYNSSSDCSSVMQNIKNSECERLSRKCEKGMCYCFSSDSDASSALQYPQIRKYVPKTTHLSKKNSPQKTCDNFTVHPNEINCSSQNNLDMNIVNMSKRDLSVQCGVAESNVVANGSNGTLKHIKIKITTRKKQPECEVNREFNQQVQSVPEILSTSEMSSVEHNSNRISLQDNGISNTTDTDCYLYDLQNDDFINQQIVTDDDEFFDCNDKKTTDTSSSSVYEDSTEYSQEFNTNGVTCDNKQEKSVVVETKVDKPLIHIVQEISQQMVVKSTVTVNRDKMKKKVTEKTTTKTKKPKKCKKIIDENFCNEILDQTLNWESLVQETNNNDYDDDLNVSTNTSLDTDDFISLGRLEASPKYSGKTIGYLMAKRLRKAEKIKKKKEIVDDVVYGWRRDIQLKTSSDFPSSDSSSSLQGPKKPPRTFASSPSRLGYDMQSSDTCQEANNAKYDSVARDYDYTTREVGWTFKDNSKREPHRKKTSPKPSCPTMDDLTRSLEWMHPVKPNVHNVYYMTVEDNSKDILRMLNYENGDVEKRKNKQRAVPQVPKNYVQENVIPPLENIDTVDGPIKTINNVDNSVTPTPTVQSSPSNFGAGLSPKKFNPNKNWIDRSYSSYGANARFCRDFIKAEKQYYYDFQGNVIRRKIICRHCTRKLNKKHKYKAALRRTKSLFVTSKKTLNKKLFKRNSNVQFEKKLNASDSELYMTPQKLDTTALMNQEFYINGRKSANKSLNLSNKKVQCYTCVDNNSRISNTYYNEDPVDNSCELPMLQNTSSPIPRATSPSSPTKNANLMRKKRDLNDFPDEIVPLESSSSENFNFQRTVNSPKNNQKSPSKSRINNQKLTPKKLFKIKGNNHNNLPTADDRDHSYKSYNQDDQIDLLVIMSDYLENIGRKIDQNIDINDNSEFARKYERENFQRSRRISTSSECVDKLAEKIVKIDLHDEPEPLYAEIGTKYIKTPINSPKKLNVNEIYINRNSNSDNNSPNKYIIVNNDPKAIYATVNKKRNLAKCESLSSGSDDIGDCNDLLKKAHKSRCSTPSSSNTTTTATHDEIEVIHDYDDESLYSLLQDLKNVEVLKMQPVTNNNRAAEMTIKEKVKEMQNVNYIKSSYDRFRNDIPNKNNGTLYNSINGQGQGQASPNQNDVSSYDASKFLRVAIGDENSSLYFTENDIIEMHRVPSNVSLTNSEIMAYREREVKILTPITEASDDFSINRTFKSGSNKSKVSFPEENNEIGYDTVDCDVATASPFDHGEDIIINYDEIDKDLETTAINPSILCTPTKTSFGSDNNISDLITSPEESPAVGIYSPASTNNKELYRSLKKKLRSSFRKSKQYIKHEGKKLTDLFDDKLGSNKSDSPKKSANDCKTNEYKPNYSDRKAEVLYQKMYSKVHDKSTDINDEDVLKLINQITNQRSIRKQLKNAVNICRNTREFEYSTELIEAERLLLISNLKENCAKHELVRIDYMNESSVVAKPIDNCIGTITLSKFEFPLKEMAIYDALFNYFYICVCSYKEQVNATQPVERVGNKVFFDNNSIQFHNIESDYKIRLEVYVLRLRKNIREYSHESKYHLNKTETIKKPFLVTCPSPSKLSSVKLFKSSPSADNTTKNNGSSPTLPIRDYDSEYSRFKTQGYIEISALTLKSNDGYTAAELSKTEEMVKCIGGSSQFMYTIEDIKYFNLNSVAYNANLIGDIKFNVNCKVSLKGSDLNGFLTIGEQIRGTLSWNRRWCKIDGFTLLFWNYPQECFDKEPLLIVDLTQCKNDIIKMADRAICPRSRTFMIELSNNTEMIQNKSKNKNNLRQCLISTDNQMDLKIWLNELNHLLSILKAWKI